MKLVILILAAIGALTVLGGLGVPGIIIAVLLGIIILKD